ncbi:MAG: peptidylprolyl isomerase [Clostridiales bacterium]|nr:peptidylprolyl isomerase [Clostridiales bacterium]
MNRKLFTRVLSAAVALCLVFCLFSGCGNKTDDTSDKIATSPAGNNTASSDNNTSPAGKKTSPAGDQAATGEHSKVKVTMESGDSFIIELYPEYAPETVANFLKLVGEGFYNGLTFHRVVDNFMAQGGDPEGTGSGGSPDTIKGEFSSNGFTQNTLSHTRGVVSMARSNAPDSASSQFFICYGDSTFLDGNYAAFGKVIEGMEVVDGFCKVERTMNSMGEMATPVNPIVMKTVEVIK